MLTPDPAVMRIRPERSADSAAVRAVNESAFGSNVEADLVERLRAQASPLVSLGR
jgi:predicted N-acetyltransferase YhbS